MWIHRWPAWVMVATVAAGAGAGAAGAGAATAQELPRISFETAIARTLARHPVVRLAQADLARAEALLEQARAPALPALSANATYTRLDGDRLLDNIVIIDRSSVFGNVTLAVPLFAPQRWTDWKRASDDVEVSLMSIEQVRRDVVLATARAYLAVISKHRTIEVTERARQVAGKHVELAQARVHAGVGGRMDDTLAQQEVATDVSRLRLLESELDQAREALGVMIGSDAPVDVEPSAELTRDDTLPVDQALAEAMSKRTDLAMVNSQLAASQWSAQHSWTDRLPTVSAIVQPFYQSPPTLTMPRYGWQAQLVFSVPLYDGGTSTGLKHQREAEVARDLAAQDDARRKVRSEVRVASRDVELTASSLAAAREASRLADAALELTNQAYQAGTATSIEVTEIERQARDAATAVVVAEDTLWQARLEYLFAIGALPNRTRSP